jgi:hypothetical protein
LRSSLLVLLTAVLAAALSPGGVYGQVTVSLLDHEFFVEFDQPKNAVTSFDFTTSLRLINPTNITETVTGIEAKVLDIPGLSASVSSTTVTIGKEGGKRIDVIFHASPEMAEGVHLGSLQIQSADAKAENIIPISVRISHPPPTLTGVWDEADWGTVRAGTVFTRTVEVRETMGYKAAQGVRLLISAFGPVTLTFDSHVGDLSPFASKRVEVTVSIPERGLTPGRYNIETSFAADTAFAANVTSAVYEIAVPEMKLDKTHLDFGKITFEAGKDSATETLILQETGGFTPLEDLSLSLIDGEEGWITIPQKEYVPPGSSVTLPFSVFLPPDASLGEKHWRVAVSSAHGGTQFLDVSVIVYFPGINDALDFLKGEEPVEGFNASEVLINNTILLLEEARGITDVGTISSIMSLYSGGRTFLASLREVYGGGERDWIEQADIVVRARLALDRMEIGEQNLADPDLRALAEEIVTSAEGAWASLSQEVLEGLLEEVEVQRERNHRKTVQYYRRISRIYALTDEEKAAEFGREAAVAQKAYEEAVSTATGLKMEAEREILKAREGTFSLDTTYLVWNPFAYEFVSQRYERSLEKYREAESLFRQAGEEEESDFLSTVIAELEAQRRILTLGFGLYGLLLASLVLWMIGRVVLGIYYFQEDEKFLRLGEITLKEEEKAGVPGR